MSPGSTREEKKRVKRKEKKKARRRGLANYLQREKAECLYSEALGRQNSRTLDEALSYLERAIHLDPKNKVFLSALARLGRRMKRADIELKALLWLHTYGFIELDERYFLSRLLRETGKYEQALSLIQETIPLISSPRMRGSSKNPFLETLRQEEKHCRAMLEIGKGPSLEDTKPIASSPEVADRPEKRVDVAPLPDIPLSIQVDLRPLEEVLTTRRFSPLEDFELTLQGYRIRFRETFESLICLSSLKEVRSFWYQEETARKVLKDFRGRALLADEVGLGKTIEALMVLKEYLQRGMVKNALILVPSSLVSQWKEELRVKFDLHFSSTDDEDYRTRELSFWDEPFILASINIAKSKNNFPLVIKREYDMVIVDEAHHLKNRNTLNWKLVNSFKKRFLLLLTATPVENNLMELYNLVTLLKPGQLKTATEFRNEFMTRGDPTDPQNRSRLRELLSQVMIRNTRALARVQIPPRFAQTIRVEPSPLEKALYERLSALVRDINAADGTRHRLLLRNLLEEAGSSPQAVSVTLSRLLQRGDNFRPYEPYEKEIEAIYHLGLSLKESSKNKTLLKLIETPPEKKIIFVKYLGTLKYIAEFLTSRKLPFALFHGQMDQRMKDEQIQSFRERQNILLTTEIGGEGRNLQFCHCMINYDLPWNPMRIEQRIGRIHRIGQEKEVLIYNLCAVESAEDYILEILDKKINMFEMVIGEIEMILGRIREERDFSEMVYDIWNLTSTEEREKRFGQLEDKLKRAKTGYQQTKALEEKLFGENYEL